MRESKTCQWRTQGDQHHIPHCLNIICNIINNIINIILLSYNTRLATITTADVNKRSLFQYTSFFKLNTSDYNVCYYSLITILDFFTNLY